MNMNEYCLFFFHKAHNKGRGFGSKINGTETNKEHENSSLE